MQLQLLMDSRRIGANLSKQHVAKNRHRMASAEASILVALAIHAPSQQRPGKQQRLGGLGLSKSSKLVSWLW